MVLTDRGVKGTKDSLFPKGYVGIFLLDFRIVTFSNLTKSKGRLDGHKGDLAENIERDFIRDGLVKAREFLGLLGCKPSRVDKEGVFERGGKSSEWKKWVTSLGSEGEEDM